MGNTRWFQDCRWYRSAPAAFRRASSIHYTYLRIGHMAQELGDALDALCPPLRVYRFVAYAPTRAGARLRHALVLRLRAALGRWPTDAEMYEAEGPAGTAGRSPTDPPPEERCAPSSR